MNGRLVPKRHRRNRESWGERLAPRSRPAGQAI